MKEEILWLPLPYNPENYEVSNTGLIRTKEGKAITMRTNGKFKHLFFEVSRYEGTCRVRKSIYIHKVVAQLFIPKPSEKHVYVTHINEDCNNNHVSNLKWITASEHASKVVNAEKAWVTRRIRYGRGGGSLGRPRLNK